MFVCICRGITDRKISELVESGASSPEQITNSCGAGGDCGSCRTKICKLVEELVGAASDGTTKKAV